jgi:hypothetical protein
MEKLLTILILFLAGCGGVNLNEPASPLASPSPSIGGVYFDSSVYDHTERAFSGVRECMEEETGSKFQQGSINDLTVVIMLNDFDCINVANGKAATCNGQFTPPNTIRINKNMAALKHEIAHYLLYVNTQDPDAIHSHKEVFTSCA